MKLVLPIRAFAAFLMALATAEIVVGVHDLALARTNLAVPGAAAGLLVIGVVLFVAGGQLIQLSRRSSWGEGERPLCKPPVVLAFLLTLMLGVYVFISALPAASAQRWVVVSVALIFIVVALGGLIYFRRDARAIFGGKEGVARRIAAIALGLLGTTIGASEFWFQNEYVPSRAGRAVALEADLRLTGERKGYEVLRATVGYENTGGRSVAVIGSTYTLTGSRVVRCQRPATAALVQPPFKGFLIDPQRSRFMVDVLEKQPSTVLAAGKFVGDGKRLDPDVSSQRAFVFLVPRRRYQLLRFRAQLFAIPGSVQLSQRTMPEWTTFANDNSLYGFWHLDDDSWLHDLISGRERWVVMRYEIAALSQQHKKRTPPAQTAPASPDLRVTARFPDPTWTDRRPTEETVNRLFDKPEPSDASEPFADTELALEGVAEPTADELEALRAHKVVCSTASPK